MYYDKTYYLFIAAIIITGGSGSHGSNSGGAGKDGVEVSAEIFKENGETCTLPDFPQPGRIQHSQSRLIREGIK